MLHVCPPPTFAGVIAARLSEDCSTASVFACGMLQRWGLEGCPKILSRRKNTVSPTIITLHEFIVLGLIIELHYICSVCLN